MADIKSSTGVKQTKEKTSKIIIFGGGFIGLCLVFMWLAFSYLYISTGIRGIEAIGTVTLAEKTSGNNAKTGCRYVIEVIEPSGYSVGIQLEKKVMYGDCLYAIGNQVQVTYYKESNGSITGYFGNRQKTFIKGAAIVILPPMIVARLYFMSKKQVK